MRCSIGSSRHLAIWSLTIEKIAIVTLQIFSFHLLYFTVNHDKNVRKQISTDKGIVHEIKKVFEDFAQGGQTKKVSKLKSHFWIFSESRAYKLLAARQKQRKNWISWCLQISEKFLFCAPYFFGLHIKKNSSVKKLNYSCSNRKNPCVKIRKKRSNNGQNWPHLTSQKQKCWQMTLPKDKFTKIRHFQHHSKLGPSLENW